MDLRLVRRKGIASMEIEGKYLCGAIVMIFLWGSWFFAYCLCRMAARADRWRYQDDERTER